MTIDSVEGSVNALEKELGLTEGLLEKLLIEDDWSFIIKIHALIEGAVSLLLTRSIGKEELHDIFSSLDLSNKRLGKMAFVKALNLLDQPDRRFISSLSELRNMMVHDISMVNFNLKDHIDELSQKNLSNFAIRFDSFTHNGTYELEGVERDASELFKNDPKKAIWYSALITFSIIYQKKEIELADEKYDDLLKSIGEKHLQLKGLTEESRPDKEEGIN